MDNLTAQTARAVAKSIGAVLVADQGVALRIRYVGSPETSSDYANAVLVSATALTLSVNGTGDATVGSSGALAFATYTTLGSLVDAINVSDNWEAEIVGGKRSDTTGSSVLLARSSATFRPYESVSLYWDSSAAKKITFLLEPAQPFARADQAQIHRVGLSRVIANVNTSDSGAYDITVEELKPNKAAALRTVFNATPADNTVEDSGDVDTILAHADYGNSLLVTVSDAGWADAGAFLKVYGIVE